LCTKCDSTTQPSDANGPTCWACPGHLERVSKTANADAPAVFEKAVAFWPIDKKGRYFRRKADKTKNCWWSF
jgi:hypothetical protein